MDFNSSSIEGGPFHLIEGVRSSLLHSIDSSSTSKSGFFIAVALGTLLSSRLISALVKAARQARLPTINESGWFGTSYKKNFVENARSIIRDGFSKFGGVPVYFQTDAEKQIMLPPEYIEAVNKEENLSFTEFTKVNFLSYLDTFRNFRGSPPGMFEEAVMKGLTRALPLFTKTLSEQMSVCLDRTWGDSKEWHKVHLRSDVLSWVARLSARIFCNQLADNEDWLRISIDYTVDSFQAVNNVKQWPSFLWRFAAIVDPTCRRLRQSYRKSTELLKPVLAEREAEIIQAQREGRKPNVPNDSIEWFREASHGRGYSDTDLQIGLSMAAIHTTSDMIGQTILNLCQYPEIIPQLREEAVSVLSKYGWQKVALTEVRLLDSFLKETQRQKPIGMASMHRKALKDVELPGGLRIQKGQHLAISSHRMWSDDVYEDADTFDPARFLKRRQQPEHQHSSHFVSTSRDHLGFSHGKHACPGRFFAANEVKIAIIHLILKYDIHLEDTEQTKWMERGVAMTANPFAMLSVRRREEEIDLSKLEQ